MASLPLTPIGQWATLPIRPQPSCPTCGMVFVGARKMNLDALKAVEEARARIVDILREENAAADRLRRIEKKVAVAESHPDLNLRAEVARLKRNLFDAQETIRGYLAGSDRLRQKLLQDSDVIHAFTTAPGGCVTSSDVYAWIEANHSRLSEELGVDLETVCYALGVSRQYFNQWRKRAAARAAKAAK